MQDAGRGTPGARGRGNKEARAEKGGARAPPRPPSPAQPDDVDRAAAAAADATADAAAAAAAGPSSASAARLVSSAGEGYVRRFLAGAISGDAVLAERFARGLGAAPPAGLDYGKLVDKAFSEAAGVDAIEYRMAEAYGAESDEDEAYVDLKYVMKSAGEFEKHGDLAEASRVYGQIAETIVDNEDLSYLSGDHAEAGPEAVEKWAKCLDKSDPKPAKRRSCIDRAFKMLGKTHRLCGEYRRAMTTLCRSDADVEHLIGRARLHAPPPLVPPAAAAADDAPPPPPPPLTTRRRGGAKPDREVDMEMLPIAADVLDRLGRSADADRLISGHARASPLACVLLVKRLAAAGSKPAAARAAAAGLDRFGADPGIAMAAASVYGEGDPPSLRCAVLSDLFMRTADQSYYDRLRSMPGWERERPSFIRRVAGDARLRSRFLVDILVKEGMHKRAIDEIAASGDAFLFEIYQKTVSAAQPSAYLAAYGQYVEALGARASADWQYASVAHHLSNMSKVRSGGREASRRVAAALAKKSAGRHNLAKALAPFLR